MESAKQTCDGPEPPPAYATNPDGDGADMASTPLGNTSKVVGTAEASTAAIMKGPLKSW
jgi:hypothetical protein